MAILDFQQPDKVIMLESDDFSGRFEFRPLEPGFGVTIGNALRRIMLSSLEGYAITEIRVPGVLHEFSTIKGMVEDVSELILNLKMVRFKKIAGVDDDKITVKVSGMEKLTGADIGMSTASYEVLNPEHIVCKLDSSAKFELELTVEKGRGYVPAEENSGEEQDFGAIAIDSIFTPIKNVKYSRFPLNS